MRLLAVITVLLVFVSVAGLAEDKKPLEKKPAVAETGKVKEKVQNEPKDVQDKKKLTWPRPYKPSEEIRADSVVPFPADI